jgi:hypothetical protein
LKLEFIFDLVLKQTKLNNHQVEDLIDETIESDLPYLCDIQLFENVKNANLLAHIERVGSVFYGASFQWVLMDLF